jgi:hypothetical protein
MSYKEFSPETSRWIARAFNTSAFQGVWAPERARILETCATTGTGPDLTDDPEGKRLFRLAQAILIAHGAN